MLTGRRRRRDWSRRWRSADGSPAVPVIDIQNLVHRYGRHTALDGLSLRIEPGEIFGLLGPNGSGKTTLFRVLSTLVPPQDGRVSILGLDLATQAHEIRRRIGVVFQSPSLDRQLTAQENLQHHGHLYGLRGAALHERIDLMLGRVGLLDRRHERVERFSGGMRRRVELAKGLLNHPRLLLLDEPSTGLDPGARIDLWRHLREIRERDGVTIVLTTHLMEEADQCTRLGILERGRLLACDTPAALKQRIGGDVITLSSSRAPELHQALRQRQGIEADLVENTLRFERPAGHIFIPQLIESFPGMIESVSVGKPTLEDVFISLTGHAFERDASREADAAA
jgi:ABC-2 type transport system ATP-binding protein